MRPLARLYTFGCKNYRIWIVISLIKWFGKTNDSHIKIFI